jgi:archaemetzincin
VAIHEIGHNLGLKHCSTPKCVMQDAVETIKTVDVAGVELCNSCKKEIGLD